MNFIEEHDEETQPLRNVWLKPKGCESGQCIKVMFSTDDEDQVTEIFIKGAPATPAEWRAFVAAMKAGEYDI